MFLIFLTVLRHHSLAFHAFHPAQLACQRVDTVHTALHNQRDDSYRTVMQRQTLTTQYNIRMFRQQPIDSRSRFSVAYQYRYRPYSLLHQVLGFWIRLSVTLQIYKKNITWQNFSAPIPNFQYRSYPLHYDASGIVPAETVLRAPAAQNKRHLNFQKKPKKISLFCPLFQKFGLLCYCCWRR